MTAAPFANTTYARDRVRSVEEMRRRGELRRQAERHAELAAVEPDVAFRSLATASPWCRSCRDHVAAGGGCPGVESRNRQRPICHVDRITGTYECALLELFDKGIEP